jgi:hypothetical protein
VEIIQLDMELSVTTEAFFYDNGTRLTRIGNGTRADVPVDCPTSSYTWPVYETLGICSACQDISAKMKFGCRTEPSDWIIDSGIKTPRTVPNVTSCGHYFDAMTETSLPMSGYILETSGSTPGEALLVRMLPLVTLERERIHGGSIHFTDVRNPIVDVVIVESPNGMAGVYRNETPNANECILSWCVQSLNSTYTWGSYSETITHVIKNTTVGDFPWKTFPFESPTLNGTDIYYTEDVNINVISDNETIITYGVSNDTMSRTVALIDDIFPSHITAKGISDEPVMRNKLYVTEKGPMTRKLLFNPWIGGNVPGHMERLATGLTNTIRSSKSSRETVTGDAWAEEVFITIQWEWLIYPFILLILSLVFLVSTMIKTAGDGATGVWKTSAMPTLIYGLPQEVREGIESSKIDHSATEMGVRKVKIRLLPHHGWRVSGQQFTTPRLVERVGTHEGSC